MTSGRWRPPATTLLKGKWWEVFGDPQLNRLEELVAIDNQNVKQAEAQFRQARALILATHANYYPTIGATGNISDSYQSEVTRHSFSIAGHRELGARSVGPSPPFRCRTPWTTRRRAPPISRISSSASRRCWRPIISCSPPRICRWPC